MCQTFQEKRTFTIPALLLPESCRNNGRVSAPLRLCYLPQIDSYTFDVWRVPSVTLKWPHAQQQLSDLAEEHVRGWTNEGGADVEVESVELHRTHYHINNINKDSSANHG